MPVEAEGTASFLCLNVCCPQQSMVGKRHVICSRTAMVNRTCKCPFFTSVKRHLYDSFMKLPQCHVRNKSTLILKKRGMLD